jgi:hypothetical protein
MIVNISIACTHQRAVLLRDIMSVMSGCNTDVVHHSRSKVPLAEQGELTMLVEQSSFHVSGNALLVRQSFGAM